MSNLDKTSKKLTQILRHKIIDYNLEITNKGYVKIDDIFNLELKEFKNINYEDIHRIVQESDKKRFEINIFDNILYIRATQGHNTDVGNLINDDMALQKLEYPINMKYIFHGTKTEFIESILQNGLKRMNRKHIHFVDNLNVDEQISGFRQSSNIILCIDINKCLLDDIIFYKSSNGVILTEGINGIIPCKYISKIL
jgi:2'-phosphotransferase